MGKKAKLHNLMTRRNSSPFANNTHQLLSVHIISVPTKQTVVTNSANEQLWGTRFQTQQTKHYHSETIRQNNIEKICKLVTKHILYNPFALHALLCSSHYYIIFSQNSSSGHIQSGSEQKWKASLWAETLPAFTHSHKLFSASCTVLSALWCVRLFACYWEDGIMTTNYIIIFELHSFWPLHHKNGIRGTYNATIPHY